MEDDLETETSWNKHHLATVLCSDLVLCLQAVDVKKLQGNKMNISTERGPLKVKAIYAESSCISSCSGRIELGNVHGEQTAASMLFVWLSGLKPNSNVERENVALNSLLVCQKQHMFCINLLFTDLFRGTFNIWTGRAANPTVNRQSTPLSEPDSIPI